MAIMEAIAADITAAGAADTTPATDTVAGAAVSAGDLESDSDGAMAGDWAGARIGATPIPDIITPIGATRPRWDPLL